MGMWLDCLLTIFASAMTLFYSEILGIAPCAWCCFKRVFLYPTGFFFLSSHFRNKIVERGLFNRTLGSWFCYALYQHYLQMVAHSVIPCPATADKASTVPCDFSLSLVTLRTLSCRNSFAFLIITMLFVRKAN